VPAGVIVAEKPAPSDAPQQTLEAIESPSQEDGNGGNNGRIPPCPVERVVEIFHEVLPELPRIERLTDTRRANIRQRWREWSAEKHWGSQAEGLDEWRRFFAYVRSSPFLMGRAKPRDPGKKPFVATLEWLMRASNHVKVFEGNYHD
jgi:hypothetical protein